MDTSYPKLTPSGKRLLMIIGVIAIVIPVVITYVLLSPPNLPTSVSTVQSSSTASSATSSVPSTIVIPAGVGDHQDSLNFQPASITVAAGTTVIWVNDDTTSTHNVYFLTMPTGATIATNPSPDTKSWTNNMYSVTLTVPGTYTYDCQYHSGWMQGTITVTG